MQQLDSTEFKAKYNYKIQSKMIKQYLDIKFEHQDTMLFFQIGDFYELFFEDALQASIILGLTLTSRGKDEAIPMCGVPQGSIDNYLHKLVESGLRVAVCGQLESPEEAKKRGNQEIVRRDVMRIVTQGTITEESILDTESSNYLVSLCYKGEGAAIAYLDLSTFEFAVTELPYAEISAELARLGPKEILAPSELWESELLAPYSSMLARIQHPYNNDLMLSAIDAIKSYIALTQKQNLINLPDPEVVTRNNYMLLDASSLRGLEILRNQGGGKKHTLFAGINHTVTKHGARLLGQYLSQPLADKATIDQRLQMTEFFYDDHVLAAKIREILKGSADIERIIARVGTNKAKPQDLLGLKLALEGASRISLLIKNFNHAAGQLQEIPMQLTALLADSIKEDGNNSLSEGGYIKPSYHPKLLELQNLLENNSDMIEKMRRKYQQATGIDSLKIAHNNVLGLFIEVSSKNASKITDPRFIHRGTTTSVVRFTTEGLRGVESDMINAKTLAIALEQEIFERICSQVILLSKELRNVAKCLAELDVFCSLAYTANTYGYVKPEITDDRSFIIKEGRHVIAERSLDAGLFAPNDCDLSEKQRLWLITGPNMAGKSTFLRQNALIAILAQMGSFVPATAAKIGVIDKIFSRIGAGDDMSRGQSTFMVEMLEVAGILNTATNRSLVILDEVGRGTSTHDGLSIAQSCLEYIHNKIRCRSLFATHYHELTVLTKTLKDLREYTTLVEEKEGIIVFLHKIVEGRADKSYGIHVAELAGLPSSVVDRAKEILVELECLRMP